MFLILVDSLILRLFIVFLFILTGFIACRKRILDEKSAKVITRLTTNILFPCLLFHTVYTGFNIDLLKEGVVLFLLSIAVSLICYLLGHLFSVFFKMQDKMRRVFLLLSFKPASGLIGVPLCIILLGEDSLLFAGPYAFGIGLVFYTLGLGLLKKGNFSWRTLINPISITIMFSIFLALLKINVPEIVLNPAKFFGLFAVPLALVVVGSIFGMLDFKKGLIDKRMFLVAFNKLIFAPALILAACIFLPIEPLAKKAGMLMAATPSSVTASMWALRFEADYIWASSAALFVGVCSIITITLLFWLIV